MKKIALCILVLTLFFSACTSTIQEDIFDSTENNSIVLNAVSEYEDQFIKFDSLYVMKQKISVNELSNLHTSIEDKLSQTHEPAILARLKAINGLLYLMENKGKKVQDYYKEAKSEQSNDAFVLLLEIRLEKENETKLQKIDDILSYDKSNPVILLEKACVLYNINQYDKAIASIDEAFLNFDNLGKTQYRQTYGDLRETIWKLYSAEANEISTTSMKTVDLTKPLTKESMIMLTKDNTSLLKDYVTENKISTNELTKKLTAYGMLSSALDSKNENNSAALILNSNAITRIMAARFLWNLYVDKKGKPELKTRYSDRFAKMPSPVSPVADIAIDNEDLDAVIGVIENEIMDLPDGKTFYPEEVLTGLDFVTIVKKADK